MVINPKFKDLIPPLSADEYKQLEENILADGIRDPLVLWGDVLVDGHNRYEIAQKHGLAYSTASKNFANDDEAVLWILQNQLGRRNLNDFQRIEITHKCEDAVKARARERQGTRNDLDNNFQEKFPESRQSRDELGKLAGVSGKTYEHAVKVIERAPDEVKQQLRAGEISINKAYQDIRRQEILENGTLENPGHNEDKPKTIINFQKERDKTFEKAQKQIDEDFKLLKKFEKAVDNVTLSWGDEMTGVIERCVDS